MLSSLSLARDKEDVCSEYWIFSQFSGPQGDLPEECRFLLFLKKEKVLTTKIFDDDEWIRSVTEAQEIITDIPEERGCT